MARKSAFEKIEEGLQEALAIARGEAKPAKLFNPPEIDARAIRNKVGMSQEDFAAGFGFSLHQIRQWEQGRSRPLGGMRAYLLLSLKTRSVSEIYCGKPCRREKRHRLVQDQPMPGECLFPVPPRLAHLRGILTLPDFHRGAIQSGADGQIDGGAKQAD